MFNFSSGNGSLELWNKGNTDATVNNYEVKKTIYSPSPTEYVEPKSAAFTGFTTTGAYTTDYSKFNVSGSFNNGWNFYCQPKFQGDTVFFSALGYRVYNTGAVADVSRTGHFWSAGPSGTSTYARLLGFSSGGVVYPQDEDYRAYGFTVPSVSE